jgi:hypothetical protein
MRSAAKYLLLEKSPRCANQMLRHAGRDRDNFSLSRIPTNGYAIE